MLEKIDSYDRFIKTFNIDKDKIYEFGINETILPPIDAVAQYWDNLKKRIYNNGVVNIRGYGRDAKGTILYINLYKHLFNNLNIKKDPTNNAVPQKIISHYFPFTGIFNLGVDMNAKETKEAMQTSRMSNAYR